MGRYAGYPKPPEGAVIYEEVADTPDAKPLLREEDLTPEQQREVQRLRRERDKRIGKRE